MIYLQSFAYDAKSSYLRGPAEAPARIREVLHAGASNYYAENGQNIETAYTDLGDFVPEVYEDIEKITTQHLAKAGPLITLGGDHSITYPIIKAHAAKYPDLAILHIDAHADLYDAYEGDPYSHACPFARIMEGAYAQRLVQVGIRTLNPHQSAQADRFGVEVHEMKDLNLTKIGPFKRPLYISLDMDGFDPAYAPGVSHHEPGGLSPRQVIDLIHGLDATVIGADIVEYNPSRDVQGITGALAAKMLKEMMGGILG